MIGSKTLDKPAVGTSHLKGRTKVVGGHVAVLIPMPSSSIREVSELHHWEYHDSLYHAEEDYPSESCEVCEKFGETEL